MIQQNKRVHTYAQSKTNVHCLSSDNEYQVMNNNSIRNFEVGKKSNITVLNQSTDIAN